MRFPGRCGSQAGLALLAAVALGIPAPALGQAAATAPPAPPPWTLLESGPDETVLRLDPATPLRVSPAADGQHQDVRLDGFGLTQVEGSPQLPRWVGRVAIPAGSQPTLEVLDLRWEPVPGVRPAPVPGYDVLRLPAATGAVPQGADRVAVLREDAATYRGPGSYPASAVRLGGVGTLRHQTYVEIVYTPLVFSPAAGGLLKATNLVVAVHHAAPASGGGRGPEPAWEPVYRRSFVNYAAGLAFRDRGAPSPAPASRGSAGSPAALALSPTYKLSVASDGLERLDYTFLQTAAPALLAEDPRTWRLFDRGVEVPIRVVGEADGSFDPGDFLEFYGEARHEPNMVLEADLSPMPSVYRETDVGGTSVYLLSGGGAMGTRVGARDGTPDPLNPLPAEASFATTAHFEQETVFLPLGGDDAWYWGPRTNSANPPSAPSLRTESLPLPGLAAVAYSARVQAHVRGTTSSTTVNPDHLARFRLNGNLFPNVTFDGESVGTLDTTVSQTGLLTDPSTMDIQAGTVSGLAAQEFILNDIDITYQRTFASAAGALRFDFADGDHGFQISGLPDASIEVYEISDSVAGSTVRAPVRITGVQISGGPPYTASFEIHPTGHPTRSFVVTAQGGLAPAASVSVDTPSSLADPANGAGYLIITSPDLIDQTPGSAFEQFVASREAEGLPVKIAYVDDIADEFADSLPGPEGIRAFLQYVFSSWTGWDADGDSVPDPPEYVLFLGDGSVDYRARFNYGITQLPWFNEVPTAIFYRMSDYLEWYSSDNWLAAVAGTDYLPDYLIGRLATRSAAETDTVLAKILAHETSPPPGAWRSHVTFFCDKGYSPDETTSFEQICASLEQTYVQPPFTSSHAYYATDFGGTNAAGMKQAILDSFDAGTGLVDYVGHGAFNIWGTDAFFTTADIPSLSNDGYEPFVVIENCLSGGFSWYYGQVMAEALVQTPGKGGVAVFAPAGLSSTTFTEPVAQAVFDALLGPQKERIVGAAAAAGMATLAADGNTVDLMGYELLGDPATHLALPAPTAPSGLSASAGNTVVHLAWSPSPGPVAGYHVYRSTNLISYSRVTSSPVTGTSFDDTSVQNATTYYYAAVAVDADGFESAWSNRNSDCAVDGPDCVKATPFDNVPPSQPTGVAASNPGTGGKVTVSWAANPEPDIKTYRVRYGTSSGQYGSYVEASGSAVQTLVGGLVNGTPYFFAVEAENFDGLVSPLSAEVTAVPTLIQGIRPPATVSGLQVVVAGNDPTSLDLSWTPVTTDIYGGPTTVAAYEIYRGMTPWFAPTLGAPQGEVAAPATSYRDTGAAADPADGYYLVVARDAAGNRSGVERDLPLGIAALTVTLLADGQTVHLSWPAIGTTISGEPTLLSGYEVHGAATPFSRAGTGPSNLLGTTGSTSFDHLPPPGKVFYYSVLPVDNRGASSPY